MIPAEYGSSFAQTRQSREWLGLTEYTNEQRLGQLTQELERVVEGFPLQHSVLAVFGSDARYERAVGKNVDLLLLVDSEAGKKHDRVDEMVYQLQSQQPTTDWDYSLFVKLLAGHSPNDYCTILGREWPDAILDAKTLLGNPDVLTQARYAVLRSLLSTPSVMTTRLKSRRQEYRKTCLTGYQSQTRLFNLYEGITYYEQAPGSVYGVKNSALRLTQVSTLFHSVSLSRQTDLSWSMLDLPSNTIAKIQHLKRNGFMPTVDIEPVIDAYAFFCASHNEQIDHYLQYQREGERVGRMESFIDPGLSQANLQIILRYDSQLARMRERLQ